MTAWKVKAVALADELESHGHPTDPRWRGACVSRHAAGRHPRDGALIHLTGPPTAILARDGHNAAGMNEVEALVTAYDS